ncbi:unnamed protein product [Phaedon cochleariae]|uniref:Transposase domain-containing protein n=1 Tax=Phaedon cochleariae TaxID=80249 RepID=A0A9P0DVT0_PHACE|nr:unnamed protein product [Phaedon cochleariae]
MNNTKRKFKIIDKHNKRLIRSIRSKCLSEATSAISTPSCSNARDDSNLRCSDSDSDCSENEHISFTELDTDHTIIGIDNEFEHEVNFLLSDNDSLDQFDVENSTNAHQADNIQKPIQGQTELHSENDLKIQLANWALHHNITHSAISDLLHILKPMNTFLPIDARTLLKTPRMNKLLRVEPGQYHHFGFENCLKTLLQVSEGIVFESNIIEVNINIDGLPLSKSSGSQLYPILCNLYKNKNNVSAIGIYHGTEKPADANDFLRYFVDDASIILNNGFMFSGIQYIIKIRGFICDVPAKSYIKYSRGHSGYQSCSKCSIEGIYFNNRICFPNYRNAVLRTDESFRQKQNENHHTGTSILETLPNIDMINNFPLDYMHLVCLGVVKKLIVNLWIGGRPSHKLSSLEISNISQNLLEQVSNIPREFNRKPRSLNEAKRWKATEFRQFLFYTGPVVLKHVLSKSKYKHFLSLHISMFILAGKALNHNIDYAGILLKYFVDTFIIIYGKDNVSHNVHNLLHICDDVRRFGSLDDFSAFPFENYMQTFKKYIRKGDKPLQQIVFRIDELNYAHSSSQSTSQVDQNVEIFPILCNEHCDGPLLNNQYEKQFKLIKFENFSLGTTEPNNCCKINENDIVIIKNVLSHDNKVFIIGQKFLQIENFYTSPCESSDLGIFLVSNLAPLQYFPIELKTCKLVKLDYKNKYVVFPLLHLS